MENINQIPEFEKPSLEKLCQDVDTTGTQIKKSMENLLGRKWEIYSEIENNLTIDAVINLGRIHLEKTQKLEKAIEEILQQKQMPSKEAIEALKTSETLISDVAKQCIKIQEEVGEEDITTDAFNAIRQADTILQALTGKPDFEKFLTAVSSKDKYDRYGLLIDGDEISEDTMQFHINLSLLIGEYRITKDPTHKKLLNFLIGNYLAKAAPNNLRAFQKVFKIDQETIDKLISQSQSGLVDQRSYHRTSRLIDSYLNSVLRTALAKEVRFAVLTDTTDCAQLLPLSYKVINVSGTEEEIAKKMKEAITTNQIEPSPTYYHKFESILHKPLLFDFSDRLSPLIITDKDSGKGKLFSSELEKARKELENMIDLTVAIMIKENPNQWKTDEDKENLKKFIAGNITCICRTKWKELGILSLLPVLLTSDNFAQRSIDKMANFISHTAINVGPVRSRREVFDFLSLEKYMKVASDPTGPPYKIVDYAVQGSRETIYFQKPSHITESEIFKRFFSRMESEELSKIEPHIVALGRPTLRLIKGLLKEIGEEKWKALNDNIETRVLLQTSLYRLMQHLSTAENDTTDFTKYAQAIELVHAEMTTLLAVSKPFKDGELPDIFKKQLDFIPDEFKKNVLVGVASSGTNAFAGINICVQNTNGKLERAHSEGAYYEQVEFVGPKRTMEDVLKNKKITGVDLYFGEFNPGINANVGHSHYSIGDIEGDISKLLKEKPDTKQLTVAIDCTIDLVNSPKVKALLNGFSQEIKQGKLNFIFFRSGLKFDLLGMDEL